MQHCPGEIIADKYELLSLLGEGSVGYVFKARHLLMDRIDAIKLLKQPFGVDQKTFGRFRLEAKAAAALKHPNIILVHDFGITTGGIPYMVMEHFDGRGLDAMISGGKKLECDQAIEIFKQVCDGLAFAHHKGVIHRDLKPSNIFVVDSPNESLSVKILDFGLAKMLFPEPGHESNFTGEGEIPGTPAYMSPEQCQNLKLDARTDIYSLGCVIYESLTGEKPTSGGNVFAIIDAHINQRPKPFSESLALPASLEAVVQKAMEKDRNDRYQSAFELRRALGSVSSSDSSSASGNVIAATVRSSPARPQEEKKSLAAVTSGYLMEWFLQSLLAITGKLVKVQDYEWLAGPKGQTIIGPGIAEEIAEAMGLELVLSGQNAGIIPDLSIFDGDTFNSASVDPLIKDFFERTGRYDMEVWSEWEGIGKPLVQALVVTLARTMNQLNLPFSPKETLRGIRNEVVSFCRKDTGEQVMAGWIRTLRATQKVMIASCVSSCRVPNYKGRFFKSVLPMPGGSYTSISTPYNEPSGGLKFVADGKKFGQPCYYRINYPNNEMMRVGVSPFKQEIRLSVDADKIVRFDVSLFFAGAKFFTFYSKMIRS